MFFTCKKVLIYEQNICVQKYNEQYLYYFLSLRPNLLLDIYETLKFETQIQKFCSQRSAFLIALIVLYFLKINQSSHKIRY